MAKTIITAALTGAVTPAGYHIPETPEQIVSAPAWCGHGDLNPNAKGTRT